MSNSVDNKRIIKNTILLYVRSLVLIIISLYTSRVVLHTLGVEDYGVYQVVGGVVSMFAILSSSLTSGSQRFITYALGTKDFNRLKHVFSNCVTLHVVLGIIVVLLLEFLGVWFLYNKLKIPEQRLDAAFWVMQFSIIAFFVKIISVPYNASIVAHEKMGAFAYISILEAAIKLSIAFVIQWIAFDKLIFYSFLILCMSLLIRSVYSMYSRRHFEECRKVSWGIDKSLFKEMFAFTGWNLLGSGSMILRNQGIDILMNMFFGVTVNAAKGVSNQIEHTLHTFVGNFTTSINPQLTKSIAAKDYARANTLVVHGSKLSFFLMMAMATPFIVCCEEIMALWLVEVPEWAVAMCKLALVYQLCEAIARLLKNAVLAYGDIRNFQLSAGIIKLMALPIAYVVLKLGGTPLTGVCVNIALMAVCLGFELYFANKRIGLNVKQYLIKVVFRCWGIFITSLTLSYLFYRFVISSVFVVVPSALVISACLIWILGLDAVEKEVVKDQIISKIKH